MCCERNFLLGDFWRRFSKDATHVPTIPYVTLTQHESQVCTDPLASTLEKPRGPLAVSRVQCAMLYLVFEEGLNWKLKAVGDPFSILPDVEDQQATEGDHAGGHGQTKRGHTHIDLSCWGWWGL